MVERKRHFRKKPRPPPMSPAAGGGLLAVVSSSAPTRPPLPPPAAFAANPPPPPPPPPPSQALPPSVKAEEILSPGVIRDADLFAAAAALAARITASADDDDAGRGRVVGGGAGVAAGVHRSFESLLGAGRAAAAAGAPLPSATFTLNRHQQLLGRGNVATVGVGGGGGGGGRSVKLKRQYNRVSMPVEAFDLLEPLTNRLRRLLAANPAPSYAYRRDLSSSTYLNRVHVVAEMANHVLPDIAENEEIFYDGEGFDDGHGGGGRNGNGSNGNGNPSSSSSQSQSSSSFYKRNKPICREPNGTLFRTKIRFLDGAGREWPITYERLRSAGQKHTRLSAGWKELCQANGLRVGDTVWFRRFGGRGEEGVVLVEKEEKGA